jgi:hypothetical protein
MASIKLKLNLTRRTTNSVLKSLRKTVSDLVLISQEETKRMDVNNLKIEQLNSDNAKHRAERDLAEKVATNLNKLLGIDDVEPVTTEANTPKESRVG